MTPAEAAAGLIDVVLATKEYFHIKVCILRIAPVIQAFACDLAMVETT